MKKSYSPPLAEEWVSNTLMNAGIIKPIDLIPERVAEAFGIIYERRPGISGSMVIDDCPMILTDGRLDEPYQRKQFFHETGHILRHEGDQTVMPKSMREYQEWDAELFAMYASIPFHMIDFTQPYSIRSFMAEFTVTEELATKRIDDIRQKIFCEQKRQQEKFVPIYTAFALENCSDETKRMMEQLYRQTGTIFA
ncbi:MAG: ImmA/IrrE family metallo-endopeptidase [Sporolactobacillus sp.]